MTSNPSVSSDDVGQHFRPDIQGLRALAVGLVVCFHLWPNRLTGGFVGVDVFFVISGYLITLHLFREVETTGRLNLARFWARRIRRLLPAAFVVLLTSTALVLVFLPTNLWAATARQVGASALYVQNWALVRDSVTYLGQDEVPTVVEHYWSLSVEEQFYVLWPLLIIGLLAVRRRASKRSLVLLLTAVTLGSLAYSVVATGTDQAVAYFATPARVWEFGAGALLALAATPSTWSSAGAAVTAWVGLAGIIGSAVILDAQSAFPGWVAIFAVLGTVGLIAAGGSPSRWSPSRFLTWRPLAAVGGISYSVYLWHWPLIVVVPFITEHALRTTDKMLILAATLALGAASKVAIEDRARNAAFLASRSWRSGAFAGLGMILVVCLAVAIDVEVDRRADRSVSAAREALAGVGPTSCTGPGALTASNSCPSTTGTGPLIPGLDAIARERTSGPYFSCMTALGERAIVPCELGRAENYTRSIAVVGDSHAGMWLPAFDVLGKELGWRVTGFAKASCPLTRATRELEVEATDSEQRNCRAWNEAVVGSIIADPSISLVVTTAFSSAYTWAPPPGSAMPEPESTGFIEVWDQLRASGKTVVVLRDVPRPAEDPLTCLAQKKRDRCTSPRPGALPTDANADAADLLPGVAVVDLSDRFCDATRCYSVIGDVMTYMDRSHISGSYARTLAPYLQRALAR